MNQNGNTRKESIVVMRNGFVEPVAMLLVEQMMVETLVFVEKRELVQVLDDQTRVDQMRVQGREIWTV